VRYLQNCWYVAAWSDDIALGKILARTILDQPIALFRRTDGSPAAIADRCPHRFAPLSAGTHHGTHIACPYHGLRFDGGGHCVLNPHGPVPRAAAVRSFPVHDAHRATWIWMGDAARADTTLIPDFSYLTKAPATAFSAGQLLSSRGNYLVFVDNIMDLSHTDFLHPTTLGGGVVTHSRQSVEETADYIDVAWHSADTRPSPLLAALIGNLPEHTDVINRVRWFAPALMQLQAVTVCRGTDEVDGYRNHTAHLFTPETQRTSHYFFAATRNYHMENGELNARIAKTRVTIFATEDGPMIDLIGQRMGDADFWSLQPVMLAIDKAPVLMRRRLQKLIDAEQAMQ
jgi:phenylpropionate dioxygenase-like ring-hydroxylating dioxygenase large terminal subunit